ncbi:ferric siderophore transport system periplasmic binding protein [Proteus hauseri ATCC 700826]|uniref:Protein TonB n=1 Tax=Proteus hauseri ATCC 700826 TaxID=1354271 RepID=A0AAJ3HQ40_PROHU|nr:TonB family protein [Proteus hauseri]OAT45142.1 ferric siderophore transport system periplasmic binding protein [Proteus hauseri ATCC 700826]
MKTKFIIFSLVSSIFLFADYTIQTAQANALETRLKAQFYIQKPIQKEFDKQIEEKPQALSQQLPYYPARAKEAKIEGSLEIKFDVDENGQVQNIRMFDSPAVDVFGLSLLQAMEHWRYETGKPINNLKMIIEFKLSNIN